MVDWLPDFLEGKGRYAAVIVATFVIAVIFWEPPTGVSVVRQLFPAGAFGVYIGAVVFPLPVIGPVSLEHEWFFFAWVIAAIPLFFKEETRPLAVFFLVVGLIGFFSDFNDVIGPNPSNAVLGGSLFTNDWGSTISWILGAVNAGAIVKIVE